MSVAVANKPPKPRKTLGRASRFVYETSRVLARLVIPLVARLRTEGLEHIPLDGAAILAPNHISWADIPLISLRVPRVTHYMAKAELWEIPLLSTYMRWLGAFSVRRGEGDREALRVAARVLSEGRLVVIFPEGHRSKEHALIEAHQGVVLIAMRANVPIIPVAISGSEGTFRKFHYGPWAPRVTVRYGEPIHLASTGKRTSADLLKATDEVMLQIAAMLPPAYRGIYANGAPERATPEKAPTPAAPLQPEQAG